MKQGIKRSGVVLLLLVLCIGGGNAQEVVGRVLSRTARVNGANVSKYSSSAGLWASTYVLNERFLTGLSHTSARSVFGISEDTRRVLSTTMAGHFQPVSELPGLTNGLKIELSVDKQLKWLNAQPNLGRESLSQARGIESDLFLVQKMADSKLVFVGETHGLVAPRLEFAGAVEKFHHFHPQRRVVIFMESLYLKPLENESVFPYDYYRRGTEGVESPFDITNTKSPNFRLMDDNSNFREMLTRLDRAGAEMYPVEDAVVSQKLLASGQISTTEGVLERNRGFARTMRAQMERIRQTDPDALFIYYGGMAHNSWSMPGSLPKFFADETPVVVELVSEKNLKTMSLLENVWGKTHPAFSLQGEKRIFFWKGPQATAYGRNVGFDMRWVVP